MKKRAYICRQCYEVYILTKSQAKHTTCKCGGDLRLRVFTDMFNRGESSSVEGLTVKRSDV